MVQKHVNIRKVTQKIINDLYSDGQLNKALLACLRDSNSILSKRAIAVWPLILTNLSEQYISRTGKPTYAENAIFTALRSYAIFQQGQTQNVFASSFDKNEKGKGEVLFVALSDLRADQNLQEGLDRRTRNLLASTNWANVNNGIIHLVQILKANNNNLQIDFARLAQDLFYFQMSYENARRVCLSWGREYFYMKMKKEDK